MEQPDVQVQVPCDIQQEEVESTEQTPLYFKAEPLNKDQGTQVEILTLGKFSTNVSLRMTN